VDRERAQMARQSNVKALQSLQLVNLPVDSKSNSTINSTVEFVDSGLCPLDILELLTYGFEQGGFGKVLEVAEWVLGVA
jgi:hypothetical protein